MRAKNIFNVFCFFFFNSTKTTTDDHISFNCRARPARVCVCACVRMINLTRSLRSRSYGFMSSMNCVCQTIFAPYRSRSMLLVAPLKMALKRGRAPTDDTFHFKRLFLFRHFNVFCIVHPERNRRHRPSVRSSGLKNLSVSSPTHRVRN